MYTSRLTLQFDEPIALDPVSPGRLRSARRLLRRKDRAAAGLFLGEGPHVVSEALARPGAVTELFVEAGVGQHARLVRRALELAVPVASVTPAELGTLTDTVTPQGVVAVCRSVAVPLADALAGEPRLVVLCDRVRDPGNLGTVVRCADAFGADAVLVSDDAVELTNPKTVRASTGSLFHLPIAVGVDLADAVTRARAAGLQVYGADGGSPCTLDDLAASGELARPTLWVLGNEAWGLPPEHVALLDRVVGVPMYGAAESLNLSTAAAVVLYAAASAARR